MRFEFEGAKIMNHQNNVENDHQNDRKWSQLSKLLNRTGPLAHPDFSPGSDNFEFLGKCKVLVIGAGGLGCELLKNLAYMAFKDVHVIDMDTIDVSNLNRQFLFREKDVGRPKAVVAAEFINQRIPSCKVTPYFCPIQEKDAEFYRSFNIVISGLDSVLARRWINGMLASLLTYDDDGNLDTSSIIPLIDGGTEGFKGNARIILMGITPCIECTLSLYPPQINYPMCTIAHKPRLPEHCIEYVKILQWPKDQPFEGAPIDGDDPAHIKWIYEQSLERASQYGIKGVTYRLTQGVVKHIIPAVASTNAIIAASCALETFKLVTNCALLMNNYMNFQNSDGIFAGVVELEKREDCPVCSKKVSKLIFHEDAKLRDVVDFLMKSPNYQMKSPAITACTPNFSTLYMASVPSLEQQTRPNLKKSLKELGLKDGHEVYVADQTTPTTLTFKLNLLTQMDST